MIPMRIGTSLEHRPKGCVEPAIVGEDRVVGVDHAMASSRDHRRRNDPAPRVDEGMRPRSLEQLQYPQIGVSTDLEELYA